MESLVRLLMLNENSGRSVQYAKNKIAKLTQVQKDWLIHAYNTNECTLTETARQFTAKFGIYVESRVVSYLAEVSGYETKSHKEYIRQSNQSKKSR